MKKGQKKHSHRQPCPSKPNRHAPPALVYGCALPPKPKVARPVVYGCALPPKLTLFQRIVVRLARFIYRLALTLAFRYAPPVATPTRKRRPAYERRQELRRAASILATAAARTAGAI